MLSLSRADQGGFSLVELLVSLFIVSIVVVLGNQALTRFSVSNSQADREDKAESDNVLMAQSVAKYLRQLVPGSLKLSSCLKVGTAVNCGSATFTSVTTSHQSVVVSIENFCKGSKRKSRPLPELSCVAQDCLGGSKVTITAGKKTQIFPSGTDKSAAAAVCISQAAGGIKFQTATFFWDPLNRQSVRRVFRQFSLSTFPLYGGLAQPYVK